MYIGLCVMLCLIQLLEEVKGEEREPLVVMIEDWKDSTGNIVSVLEEMLCL